MNAKVGQTASKEVWVACPRCKKHFNVSELFFAPKFRHVQLHCPWCGRDFHAEESPETW